MLKTYFKHVSNIFQTHLKHIWSKYQVRFKRTAKKIHRCFTHMLRSNKIERNTRTQTTHVKQMLNAHKRISYMIRTYLLHISTAMQRQLKRAPICQHRLETWCRHNSSINPTNPKMHFKHLLIMFQTYKIHVIRVSNMFQTCFKHISDMFQTRFRHVSDMS